MIIFLLIVLLPSAVNSAEEYPPKKTNVQNQINNNLLPRNYQQFKHNLAYMNISHNKPSIINFGRRTDYTMLYVAGGILVATSSFVLINGNTGNQDYFSSSNIGVMIGGGISTVIFLTKFFLDQNRRR
jgi:hypothetical protein